MAREDIKGIGRYTKENWGTKQRDYYLDEIDKTIQDLRANKRLGRPRDDIREGLLSWACQQHMIFFKRDGAANVEILRILNQSMDFARHL